MAHALRSSDFEQFATASHERRVDGSACPDDETWALLAEGALARDLTDDLARHAEQCESCHLALAGLDLVPEPDLGTAPTELGATSLPTTARAPAVDQRLGRYAVIATLGEGGMGVVYKAHDPELDRHVALKLLKPSNSAGRDELVVRLQREARSMAKLSHPNVVTVYDVGKHEGGLYIAMELVQGGTLDTYVREAKPPLVEIIRCFRDVARALASAHDTGLVHRDLKPQNVLVSREGVVKVSDFGLARSAGTGSDRQQEMDADAVAFTSTAITRTGQIVGTPAYMAPEQFVGGKTDGRTDVFSFGVALYEAMFGVRPFPGGSISELRANVLAGRRRPSSTRPARDARARAAFDAVDKLLDRSLSPQPSERPSMRALELALEALRTSLIDAGGGARVPSGARWAIIGFVMLAGAGVVVGVATPWRKSAPTPAIAASPTDTQRPVASLPVVESLPSVEPPPLAAPALVASTKQPERHAEAKPRPRPTPAVKTAPVIATASAAAAPQRMPNEAPILR